MSRCKGPTCGAEVAFVRSAKSGKRMILDADPQKRIVLVAPDGTILERDALFTDEAVARVVDTYLDHHATCPDVAGFARPRSAS